MLGRFSAENRKTRRDSRGADWALVGLANRLTPQVAKAADMLVASPRNPISSVQQLVRARVPARSPHDRRNHPYLATRKFTTLKRRAEMGTGDRTDATPREASRALCQRNGVAHPDDRELER